MKPQIITIQYAHCVKWTPGQLDCAPFSAYKMARTEVTLKALPAVGDIGDDITDWVVIRVDTIIGEGETPNEAIADAQWRLMAESRTEAMGKA